MVQRASTIHVCLNWDVVVGDFMASEFHAIVAAILKRFSPLMVLLIMGIASRDVQKMSVWYEQQHVWKI